MPTVLLISGARAVIYPNDHRPAHVHVIGGGKEAVFNLHCPDGPPELRENYGFTRVEARRLKAALQRELTALCRAWSDIHGST
jgi:hypothetical protein